MKLCFGRGLRSRVQVQNNLLTKQLAMNEQAWEILVDNGVNSGDEFCLNFKFTTSNHACSEALKDFISRKTDYTVHIALEIGLRKNWSIEGATKPVKISKEIIDQWVSEMVKLGLQYECTFSGWWVWKYDDAGCTDGPCTKNLGSFVETRPKLVRRLAQLINK